jgi:hypothetical protein
LPAFAAVLAFAVPVAAQPAAAPFPSDKQVSMHVGVNPGAGNDHVKG